MRHAGQLPRPLPKFSLLYLESLEDRLLFSGLIPAPTPVLPEPGVVTNPALVHGDPHPRTNQQVVSDPAASMQRSENGIPEPMGDQYFAAGGSGDSTAAPSTSPDDSTPDDDYDYSTQAGADGVKPGQHATIVTGGEGPGAVDYPSDTASAHRTEQADGMAGSDEAYEDEAIEEYEKYPPSDAGFVQPLVTRAPATEHEPSSHTSSVSDQVPPPSRSIQPSATTTAGKGASDQDTTGRLLRDSDSEGAEDVPSQPSAAPDPVAELESLTDEVFQELAGAPASLAAEEPIRPARQPGNLLAGASPIDLATLKRAANKVLARLEALGKEMAAAPNSLSQSQWLVIAILAAGTLELARRRIRRRSDSTPPEGWDELSSHLFPVLAMPPKGEL